MLLNCDEMTDCGQIDKSSTADGHSRIQFVSPSGGAARRIPVVNRVPVNGCWLYHV
jgi:hypothetical protein